MLQVNSTGEPYLENACCISNNPTSLEYFKEKDSSIEDYHRFCKRCG